LGAVYVAIAVDYLALAVAQRSVGDMLIDPKLGSCKDFGACDAAADTGRGVGGLRGGEGGTDGAADDTYTHRQQDSQTACGETF
jgi:hypothetical protein